MILNRENILRKTNGGLTIYAYVLRQYYPQNRLKVSGCAVQPTKNPCNEGKQTLVISTKNGTAVHSDLELYNFSGDVFDFANWHFKADSRELLYYLINQVMHLDLKVEKGSKLAWLDIQDDSWVPKISFFPGPIRNVFPSEEITLAEVFEKITDNRFSEITSRMRACLSPKEKRFFKANYLPYVTFSGTFKRRGDNHLVQHSRLLVIDFDDLPHIEETKQLLLQDDYIETELLFTSPSGRGLKWVIRIEDDPIDHIAYFEAVSYYLQSTHHLEVDATGRDVSRACFLAHDPNAYLHPRHRPL